MLDASWVVLRDPLARILAASVALVGLPLAVTILVIVACAVFGVTIDASRWRDVAERSRLTSGRDPRRALRLRAAAMSVCAPVPGHST
ncbi:MAG: hypothetical protein WCA12_10275 [Burkholderiales bacterium]